jgi:predicted nucleic acid-binding protein
VPAGTLDARMCTSVRFVDTSVLLYAISKDPAERSKADVANRLLSSRDLALSVQVLEEFYVQAASKDRADRLTAEQAAGLVESFRRFAIQETTVCLALAATDTARRLRVSYWDAAILEAARLLECDVVLSEGLTERVDGLAYVEIDIVNPFSGY